MSQRTKGRGPYANGVGRRGEIVQAAAAAFAEHGYERASLRDVAQRAGISHSTLLHHFAGKDALLDAVLRQREVEDRERAAATEAAGASLLEVLSGQMAVDQRDPGPARAWQAMRVAATDPTHPAHSYFLERQRRVRAEMVQGWLARKPGSTPAEAEAVATALQGLLAGLPVIAMTDTEVDVQAALALFLDLIGMSSSPVDAVPATQPAR